MPDLKKSSKHAPIRKAKVECLCGQVNDVTIPAHLQPLDVAYSPITSKWETVEFKCGERSKNGCKKMVTCSLCEGRDSARFQHPLERFIEKNGRGTWPGRVLMCLLLAFFIDFILQFLLIDTVYYQGVTGHLGTFQLNMLIKRSYDFGVISILIFSWFYLLRLFKIRYGKLEKYMPDEYKIHLESTLSNIFAPSLFILSILLTMGLLTAWGMNLSSDNRYVVIYNVLTQLPGAIFIFSAIVQFLVGGIMFFSSMAMPRYAKKSQKDIARMKSLLDDLFRPFYIYVAVIAITIGFGALVWPIAPFDNDFFDINNFNDVKGLLISPGLLVLGPLIIFFFQRNIINKIDRWAVSKEKKKEHMIIELVPTTDGSRVHIETTHPRQNEEAGITNSPSIENIGKKIDALVSVASMFVSRGAREQTSDGPIQDSLQIQKQFLYIGKTLFKEYFKEKVLESYVAGFANDNNLTVTIRATGKNALLPWEILSYKKYYISLRANVVRSKRALDVVNERLIIINKVLIVGNDAKSSKLKEFVPLSRVNSEVSTLSAVLKGTVDVKVLVGEDATREKVLHELRKGIYHAFHFSGHSFFDKSNPVFSYLLLHNDEKLTAQDLNSIRPDITNLKLIFLNSCNSGSSASTEDSNLDGLADALTDNGIPYVIGMQWEVTDRGSAEFSKAFYRAISKDKTPEEAVRIARNRCVDKFGYNDPIWAAPILFRA